MEKMHLNLRHGALHRALGKPLDHKFSREELEAAKNSKNPRIRKMATLALTMRGWHHGGKK